MDRQGIYGLEVSALLHDIGKIGLSDSILNKGIAYSEDDWKAIDKQNRVGVSIVQAAFNSDAIPKIIAHHHDCLAAQNGGNSPIAEYYQEIPVEARIISVCDAFDDLFQAEDSTVARVENAISKILDKTPAHFDPQIVRALIKHVRTHGYAISTDQQLQVSPREAHAIGKNIELLFQAIADEDVDQLRGIVDGIKVQAVGDNEQRIDAAVGRLESAMDSEGELERVLELAEEVMALCRSTRRTFVGSSEVMAEN